MGFISSVKGYWPFSNNLEDEISNNDFTSSGYINSFIQYSAYNLLSGVMETKYGIKFDNYYTADSVSLLNNSGTAHDFSIFFWWYSPEAVGYTRHAVTRKQTSKVIPIIGKGMFADDGTTVIVYNAEFMISEVASTTEQNAIKLEICTTNNEPTHEYFSEAYDPGLHHVAVSYKATTDPVSEIKIIIDGKQGDFQSGPEYNMSTTLSNIYLNRLYNGYRSHLADASESFISDLIIKTGYSYNAIYDAVRYIRFGADYITSSSLSNVEHEFFGIGFSQPSTVTTKQIYTSGGNIYVARSNGDILKGYRPIWNMEYDYISDSDILVSDPKVTVTENGLRVSGTTVRI